MDKTSQKIFISLVVIFIAVSGLLFYLKFKKADPLLSNNPLARNLPEAKEFKPKVILNSSDWNNYSNKSFGVSFKYPKDFEVHENLNDTERGYLDIGLNPKGETYYFEEGIEYLININVSPVSKYQNKNIPGSKFIINNLEYIFSESVSPAVLGSYGTIVADKNFDIGESLYLREDMQHFNIYENIIASLTINYTPQITKLPDKELKPETNIDKKHWKEYTNTNFGISFKYPDFLDLQQYEQRDYLKLDLTPKQANDELQTTYFTINVLKNSGESMRSIAEKMEREPREIINGHPYIYQKPPLYENQIFYQTIKNERYIDINGHPYPTKYHINSLDLQENILSTLKIN